MIYKEVTITVSTTTGRGQIVNNDGNWDACVNATDGDSTGDTLGVRSQRGSGDYQIKRVLLPIDTSSIPVYAYILSAKLQLYCSEKTNNIGSGTVYLVTPTTQASTSSVSTADFNDVVGSVVAYLTNDYITLNAYNDFIISNPNTVIQKGSTTKFGLREYWEYFGSFPTSENSNIYTFQKGDETYKPLLVIKYALYGTTLPLTM